MEKLIELLNEYNRDVLKWSDMWELKNSKDNPWTKYITLSSVWAWKIYLWIISKEYWFIKWLVDEEYIDNQSLEDICIGWAKQDELLIMLLAISDTPIDDLILYLK